MPEIKNSFTQGKMNKDLDERLIPNGQYRDALNIEISTSESSDVGALKNILGNKLINVSYILNNSTCVSSIADEKNDALYWLVDTPEDYFTYESGVVNTPLLEQSYRDLILKYKDGVVTPVFVDFKRVVHPVGDGAVFGDTMSLASNEGIKVGMKVSTRFFNPQTTEFEIEYPDLTVISINGTTIQFDQDIDPSLISWLIFKLPSEPILQFNRDRLITGINIIDDMLFWTDNYSEPKKINISRSIEGTDSNGLEHTKLINESRDITIASNINIRKEHVTVIKKSPTNPLKLKFHTETPTVGVTNTTSAFISSPGTLLEIGDVTSLTLNVTSGTITQGQILLLQPQPLIIDDPLPSNYQIRIEVLSQSTGPFGNPLPDWDVEILFISPSNFQTDVIYDFEQDMSNVDWLFKLKFPRFATRYKYEDNEYSCFSPFSEVAFLPKEFRYKTKEGYNLGMENGLTKITLENLIPKNIPDDVVQVDILYKESNSPNIYLVDSIKPKDSIPLGSTNNSWYTESSNTNMGVYDITSETIYSVLPSNQLLRPWDNVPRLALAQDISGSRIVYANYLQNYDLKITSLEDFHAEFNVTLNSYQTSIPILSKSIKSQREYQVGVTYLDEYGRETPILTDKSGVIKVPKSLSKTSNQISIQLRNQPPSFAKSFKFYVKETSSEYYNLVMDRFYDARDGNVWLSFYSYDRNKIDEETWLELKKGTKEIAVEDEAKYKVLAIENEAPEYIKTVNKKVGTFLHVASAANLLFPNDTKYPLEDRNFFSVGIDALANTAGDDLHEKEKLRIRLTQASSLSKSEWYDVDSVIEAGGEYLITIDKPFGPDAQFVDATTDGVLEENIALEITEAEIKNKPEFDGRFFVKILRDATLREYVLAEDPDLNLMTVGYENLYFFDKNVDYFSSGGGSSTVYWTSANGGFPTDYEGSENYYLNYQIPNIHADDFRDVVNKWRWYFGTGASDVPGEPGGPKWIIDKLQYAGKMPDGTEYTGWVYANQTGERPVMTQGASGNGVDGYTIDISFVGIDQPNANSWSSYSTINWEYWFDVGEFRGNELYGAEKDTVTFLETAGQKIKFDGDTTIYTIVGYEHFDIFNYQTDHRLGTIGGGSGQVGSYSGFLKINNNDDYYTNDAGTNCTQVSDWFGRIGYNDGECLGGPNRRRTWRLTLNKVIGAETGFNPEDVADGSTTVGINFLEEYMEGDDETLSNTPAVWETEPKPTVDIDLYYEASQVYSIDDDGTHGIKVGNFVRAIGSGNVLDANDSDPILGGNGAYPTQMVNQTQTMVIDVNMPYITLWNANTYGYLNLPNNSILKFYDAEIENGVLNSRNFISVAVEGDHLSGTLPITTLSMGGFTAGTPSINTLGDGNMAIVKVDPNYYNGGKSLNWFNCYAFGNGVESDRIRDDFNAVTIDNGAKASTISIEPYEEEHRKYGLIYSGLYNSNSGVNNLNQFIQAEKITKDLNPTHGTIQNLLSRNTDLVAFCEDKIIKILANKDAVFNADGNPNLTANKNVLGQAMPFVGEYGISKNPESLATESYRAYFTDKQRGCVLRLSMDGLTPISEYGMSDWFKDNLKLGEKVIGSYDDRKEEYNITIKTNDVNTTTTVSYTERVKGFASFKSFIPENGVSMANDYFTFKEGKLYKHHVPQKGDGLGNWIDSTLENANNYNVFYNVESYVSTVDVLMNEAPSAIKSFRTLGYEGTQSKINQFTTTTINDAAGNTLANIGDREFYNLEPKDGWYVGKIETDQQEGSIKEFIEKEGLWDNYIIGKPKNKLTIDPEEFSFQGIGLGTTHIDGELLGCTCGGADINGGGIINDCYGDGVAAFNYNPNANIDDGSCYPVIVGCMDPTASNYIAPVNDVLIDINTPCVSCCVIYGCTDSTMFNYNPLATVDDGSCIPIVLGCTDDQAINWNPMANVDDGSCIYPIYGCMDSIAINYNPNATVNAVSATDPSDPCIYCVYGCMDNITVDGCGVGCNGALNYNSNATCDDGSCVYCIHGCMDPTASNFNPLATCDDGSCVISGCTDPLATNFNPLATVDDGSCTYISGCTDPNAYNYNPNAVTDDGSCLYCSNAVFPVNFVTTDPNNISGANFDNGTITANVSGTAINTPYTYSWIGPNSFSSTGNTIQNLIAGTYNVTITDVNGCTYSDSVVLQDEIYGCIDPNAFNFNPNATIDDGSCIYSGCLDPVSTLFCNNCTLDCLGNAVAPGQLGDTSCCGFIPGCTDPNAINQNPLANQDDGSCIYEGCTDSGANNFLASAGPYLNGILQDDGSCEYWGCLDLTADNYNGCTNGQGVSIPCTHDCAGNTTSVDTSCCSYCSQFTAGITTASSTLESLCALPTGEIYINFTGGISPYTFSWTGIVDASCTSAPTFIPVSGVNLNQLTGLYPGTYTCDITDGDGCIETITETITETPPCTLVVSGGSFNASTFDIENVDITGGVGAMTFDIVYSDGSTTTGSITNSTGNTFNAYPANWAYGNVDITVTDASGCTSTLTINIPAYPCNISLSYTQTNISTNGGADGEIIINATGLNASLNYTWYLLVGGTTTSQALSGNITTQTYSNLSAGTYTITVEDDINPSCWDLVNITITEPPNCNGAYQCKTNISSGGGNTTNSINGVGGSISGVFAHNGNCPTCSNASFNGAPYTLYWSGPGGWTYTQTQTGSGGGTISVLTPGTYNVYAIDNNGCTSSIDSIVVGNTISGCTDPIATNYNSSATVDDGSCTYPCNLSVNPVNVTSDESCGCDGYFHIQGVTGNNAVQGFDYTITPNPITGTGSFTGSNATMNVSFGLVCAGTYTLDVVEQNSGPGFPNTGCTASTTFTVDAAILGCMDNTANNYNAAATCLDNVNQCCYTVSGTALLPAAAPSSPTLGFTSSPGVCDASMELQINGLPDANLGNAIVEYRVIGYGNAVGFSTGAFQPLTAVSIGSATWNNIPLAVGTLCDGNYLLQLKVNDGAGCSMHSQYFTINPG